MNLNALQHKLIEAARHHSPSEAVPYAFEKRITALLRAQPRPDPLAIWSRLLWRAAVSSVAIMVLSGIWALTAPAPSASLAEDLDTTVLAGLQEIGDNW